MKPIQLGLLSVLFSLSLAQVNSVKAANFEFDLKSSSPYGNSYGSGYLQFNNLAFKQVNNKSFLKKNKNNKIKLSELSKLPEINLKFNFELQDTAFFGYGSKEIQFTPQGDPEFVFEFVDGLGYLTGINYNDSQPLSLSSCHYMYCADFEGNFVTTWTGNTFSNQGLGTVKSYEWQLVYNGDEESGQLISDWELILQDTFQSSVYGEFDGRISFTTLEAIYTPEPLIVLGCGTAIGFATAFKSHLAKKGRKSKIQKSTQKK